MGGKPGIQHGIKLPTKFFVRNRNSHWTTGKTGQINALTEFLERDKDMTDLDTARQLRNTESQDGDDKDWGNGTNWRLGSDRRCRPQSNPFIYTNWCHLFPGTTETASTKACEEILIIRAVYTTMILRILVFWDLMMSSGVNGDRRFGRTQCLHLQGFRIPTRISLHTVLSQNIRVFDALLQGEIHNYFHRDPLTPGYWRVEEDTSRDTQTDQQAKYKYKLLEDKPFQKRLNDRGHPRTIIKKLTLWSMNLST